MLVTPVRHTGTPAICPLVGTPRSRGEIPLEEEEGRKGAAEGSEDREDDAAESGDLDGATSDPEEKAPPSEPLCSEEADDAEGNGGMNEEENGGKSVGSDAGAGGSANADLPSFVYQRRKFVLKRVAAAERDEDSEDMDDREEEEEEADDRGVEGVGGTFGLVELPIGWPLGR